MKKIFLQGFIIFLLSTVLFAQNNSQKVELIDEFGNIGMEDLAARLDYFMSQLLNKPDVQGIIRIYGGKGKAFASPFHHGALIKAYVKNTRKFPADRVSVQFCNVNKEPLRTQLFIAEENEKIEKCSENLSVPKETVLFESLSFDYNAEFSSKKPFEDTVIDVVGTNERGYSQTSQSALLNLLNKSPESKIYLIGYLGTNLNSGKLNDKGEYVDFNSRKLDKPEVLNKLFRQIEKEFAQSGIAASRIVKIYGGYRDTVKNIEIWLVPKNGEIPKPKPDYFPKKKRNKKR